MYKLVFLLSCLVGWSSAGHIGLDQLWWLQRLPNVQNSPAGGSGQYSGLQLPTVNQRQKFLLDILLQVDKPLVNTELIEMGKVLNDNPELYTDPQDDLLMEFLIKCHNQELLGRNDIYNDLMIDHARQMLGFYKMLVLANDWSIMKRNICFGRLHLNPVMLVQAVTLAIRDRSDIQGLMVPAIHEILPELFYDRDVIAAAQNINWNDLVMHSEKPTLDWRSLKLLTPIQMLRARAAGLWHPWQILHMKMLANHGLLSTPITQRPTVTASTIGVTNNGNSGKIVVPVQVNSETPLLTDDIGLNVFWKNVMIERQMQTLTGGIFQNFDRNERWSNTRKDDSIYHTTTAAWGVNKRVDNMPTSNRHWMQAPVGGRDSVLASGIRHEHSGSERDFEDIDNNSIERIGIRSVKPSLGSTTVDNDRLLYVDRRRQQQNLESLNRQTEPWGRQQKSWRTSVGQVDQTPLVHDTMRVDNWNDLQRRGDILKNRNDETSTNPHRWTIDDDDDDDDNDDDNMGMKWNPEGINKISNLPTTNINDDRLLHVSRRRMNMARQLASGNTARDETTVRGLWNEHGKLNNNLSGAGAHSEVPSAVRDAQMCWGRFNDNYKRGPRPQAMTGDSPQQMTNSNADTVLRGRTSQGTEWHSRRIIDGDRLMIRRTNDVDDDDNYGDDVIGATNSHRPRSISANNVGAMESLLKARSGEVFIQSLLQLVARVNMDKIALNLEGKIGSTTRLMNPLLQGAQADTTQRQTNLPFIRVQQSVRSCGEKLMAIIDGALQQQQIDRTDGEQVMQVIGDILIGRTGGIQKHGSIMDDLLVEVDRQLAAGGRSQVDVRRIGNIREPIQQAIVKELVEVINSYKRDFLPYRMQDLLTDDLIINDIDVDRLVTYTELVDTDLINVVDTQLLESNTNNLLKLQQKVVARQERLNHQPFTIFYDLTAKRDQAAVVRTWLGPTVDEHGRPMRSIGENQADYILLDAFVANLHTGTNIIPRNSRDIMWSGREVTTLNEIYKHVMTGQSLQQLVGANCQYPQRLLLPRGITSGLPVQFVVVVTPLQPADQQLHRQLNQSGNVERLCGLGVVGIQLDQQPLGFPLDRGIMDVEQLTLPNILLKDDIIQHNSHVHGVRV